jgi:hypothetical protein
MRDKTFVNEKNYGVDLPLLGHDAYDGGLVAGQVDAVLGENRLASFHGSAVFHFVIFVDVSPVACQVAAKEPLIIDWRVQDIR